MSRFAAIVAILLLGMTVGAQSAQAQFPGVGGRPSIDPRPGPEPADNRANALKFGKQLVGYGGKCLDLQNKRPVMRTCDVKAVSQRFVMGQGHLQTALNYVLLITDFTYGPRERWLPACLMIGEQNAIWAVQCGGGGGRQDWKMDGRILRGIADHCLDVAGNSNAENTPVLGWRCHGEANQQWVWR